MDLFHQKWTWRSYILPMFITNALDLSRINFGNRDMHRKYTWALRRQHLCAWNGSESQHLLDVFEGDFLCLLGGDGCDVHLQGCQPQGYVVFQLGPKSLLNHVVTTLQKRPAEGAACQRTGGRRAASEEQVTQCSSFPSKARGLNVETFPPGCLEPSQYLITCTNTATAQNV